MPEADPLICAYAAVASHVKWNLGLRVHDRVLVDGYRLSGGSIGLDAQSIIVDKHGLAAVILPTLGDGKNVGLDLCSAPSPHSIGHTTELAGRSYRRRSHADRANL